MNDRPVASWFARSAVFQLVLSRIREFYREPEAVFWTYGFPLLMATALGVAFRERPLEKLAVDVVATEAGEKIAAQLAQDERFEVGLFDEAECRRRLRTGKSSVVVRAGESQTEANAAPKTAPTAAPKADDGTAAAEPSVSNRTSSEEQGESAEGSASHEYWYDFQRPESVLARNGVDDALQRAAGRTDPLATRDEPYSEPGGRYIDFLVPGLLGMSLMSGGLWGVGFVIVDMRIRKLLKRLLATPMRKSQFLAAILLSRLAFLIPEVLLLLVFARFAFGVVNYGGLGAVLALILLGAAAFSGLGLLIASRAKTLEAVSGLMNLVMLPMWVLSGIFFSSERFPEAIQPAVKLLPLTLVIDALRAVMLDGLPLTAQLPALIGLTLWGGLSFALALRWFRWQ